MIERLLRPVRRASTWRALVHAVLDVPIGVVTFVPVAVLLALAAVLLITFPLAVPPTIVLLWFARLVGRVERNRLATLHGVALADPIPPSTAGSWWSRFTRWLRSAPRWKEVGYCLLRLPAGLAFAGALLFLWCGSAGLVLLPFYQRALPGDTADLGLFDVAPGAGTVGLALLGLVGVVLVAPWATVVVGQLDVAMARWLLAPPPGVELVAKASRAETHRAAAVDAAETERRRIERDLHDGAQQRLVALAMDLGDARERLVTDPEQGRFLVAQAHEEAKSALREIRDLVRGIHPVILEDRGLDAALSAVVARSSIPVQLSVDVAPRPPAPVESTAYFVVSEALANVERHAGARHAHVAIARSGDRLIVEVRDDGVGGADASAGTGLAGLAERVVGMGGAMDVLSPAGGPTTVLVELPCGS